MMHRLVRPALAALFPLSVLVGCPSEVEFKDGDPDNVDEPREVDCPQWQCEEWIECSIDDLVSCFGWDTGAGWTTGGVPDGVDDNCNPNIQTTCDIPIASGPIDGGVDTGLGECICPTGAKGDPAPDECCYDLGEESQLEAFLNVQYWAEELNGSTLNDITAACGSGIVSCPIVVECTLDGTLEEGELSDRSCDSYTYSARSGSEYIFEVDPALSYILVTHEGSQGTATASGFGSAATATPAFLATMIDVGTIQLGGITYEDFRFWFDVPIQFGVNSGDFIVPQALGYEIEARGRVGGDWMNATFGPTANATGEFDSSSWELDYSSTFAGGSVVVHLEGPLYAVSL